MRGPILARHEDERGADSAQRDRRQGPCAGPDSVDDHRGLAGGEVRPGRQRRKYDRHTGSTVRRRRSRADGRVVPVWRRISDAGGRAERARHRRHLPGVGLARRTGLRAKRGPGGGPGRPGPTERSCRPPPQGSLPGGGSTSGVLSQLGIGGEAWGRRNWAPWPSTPATIIPMLSLAFWATTSAMEAAAECSACSGTRWYGRWA